MRKRLLIFAAKLAVAVLVFLSLGALGMIAAAFGQVQEHITGQINGKIQPVYVFWCLQTSSPLTAQLPQPPLNCDASSPDSVTSYTTSGLGTANAVPLSIAAGALDGGIWFASGTKVYREAICATSGTAATGSADYVPPTGCELRYMFPSSPALGTNAYGQMVPVAGSFTAAGDLSGSSTSQEVIGLLGKPLPSLITGYPYYNGSAWVFQTPSGTGTVTSVSFTGDGVLLSSTPSSAVTSSGTLAAALASQSANTTLAAVSVGNPSWVSLPSCSAAGSALQWLSGTGYQCNTSITAAAAPASGLTGTSLPSGITGSSLTGVGTIATGVWQGTAIGKTYIGGQAGSGAGLTTGPTTSTSGDVATFNGTSGQIQDSGTLLSSINPCVLTSHDASAFSLSGTSSQKASSINIPANCITTSGMLTVSATCVATVAASQTASTFTPLFYFYDNTGSSEKILTTGTATASVAASSSTEITLTGMVLVPYATQPGYYITGGQVMNAPGGSSTSILGGLANAGSGSAYLVYGSTGNRIDAYFATSVANSTANTIQCTWAIHS